jgi:hypothetical protein
MTQSYDSCGTTRPANRHAWGARPARPRSRGKPGVSCIWPLVVVDVDADEGEPVGDFEVEDRTIAAPVRVPEPPRDP